MIGCASEVFISLCVVEFNMLATFRNASFLKVKTEFLDKISDFIYFTYREKVTSRTNKNSLLYKPNSFVVFRFLLIVVEWHFATQKDTFSYGGIL